MKSLRTVLFFGAPVFVMLFVILLAKPWKTHPVRILATYQEVNQTLAKWSAIDPNSFIAIENTDAIANKVRAALVGQPLTTEQVAAAERTAEGTLRALQTGDFDLFMRVRMPVEPGPIAPRFEGALLRFSRIPDRESPTAMDHYRSIWEGTFKDRGLWNKINMPENQAISIVKVSSTVTNWFEMPEYDSDLFYMRSHVSVPFDYSALQQMEIDENGHLLLWQWFFFAECPPPDGVRPFQLVFFWSTPKGVWIPIQFTHQFVKNPAVVFRFF
jgi:hypothetical protein